MVNDEYVPLSKSGVSCGNEDDDDGRRETVTVPPWLLPVTISCLFVAIGIKTHTARWTVLLI
jgi:hypothetical protein